MNLITRLFKHHRDQEKPSADLVGWPGRSGKVYHYEVHLLETAFQPLPGNYIYACQSEDGRWNPIYIAQTRDMRQRLEGHVTVADAMQNGATHIHAHYCPTGQAARCSEERDLLLLWQPVCNDPVEA